MYLCLNNEFGIRSQYNKLEKDYVSCTNYENNINVQYFQCQPEQFIYCKIKGLLFAPFTATIKELCNMAAPKV